MICSQATIEIRSQLSIYVVHIATDIIPYPLPEYKQF